MISTGTTLSVGVSAWSDHLLDIAMTGMKRKPIETTSLGTTVLTSNATQFGTESFIPESLSVPGQLKFKIQLDPDNLPKVDSSAQDFFVVWPNYTMWSGSGHVEQLELSDPEEQIMTGEYVIKISGNVRVDVVVGPITNDVGTNVTNDDGALAYAY